MLDKEHLIFLVEKAMTIQNEGGIERKLTVCKYKEKKEDFNEVKEQKVKTAGGVLFSLIRSESGLNAKIIKSIFKKDLKDNTEKKKVLRKMNKLLLNI